MKWFIYTLKTWLEQCKISFLCSNKDLDDDTAFITEIKIPLNTNIIRKKRVQNILRIKRILTETISQDVDGSRDLGVDSHKRRVYALIRDKT